MTVKCPKCHSDNPETLKFCGERGTQLLSSKAIRPEVTETLHTTIKELTTGSTFANRYQIIEELGEGGIGRVYRVLGKKLRPSGYQGRLFEFVKYTINPSAYSL